ncbi:MAG: hypothetical protein IKN67_02675 [Alphaproteobacteria bacterium]|nr:hypothetical protein [Alphaproteobacteria bacterium]
MPQDEEMTKDVREEADEFNRRFPVENVSKNREEMRTKKARYDILKNRLGNNGPRGM